MSVLAVDAGRTNCRAALVTADDAGGLVRGASVSRPAEATLVDRDGAARVAQTVHWAIADLTATGGADGEPAEVLVVAAAGALRPEAAAALADALVGSGVPVAEVVVACDVVAAHAGAFGGGPGVVLAVGTGAVALAVGEDGQRAVVDGTGYLIGDAGGGFTIGRAGLAAAMRHADGRAGGSELLAEAAAVRFGTLVEVPYALHAAADPARQVASFAADVADAARASDPVAAAIWREAVAELAETVAAACRVMPGGTVPVALVGSMFTLDDLLTGPLRAELVARHPEAEVRVDPGDVLLGAARLARSSTGRYGPLVVRRPG